MNKPYVKYFLIAGVVLVWGLIVVNVVKGVSHPAQEKLYVQNTHSSIAQALTDSFSLINDYPDPFLPVLDTVTEITKATSLIPNAIATRLSNDSLTRTSVNQLIQFNGVIRIAGKKKMLAMVTINGQSFVVKEGQTVSDFYFKKISRQDLKIVYHKKAYKITSN